MKRGAKVAVVTADIIESSRYSRQDRQKLDRVLRQAFVEAERRFPGVIRTRMAFRITAGDEFQCVVADIPRAFDFLLYVRAVVAGAGLRPAIRFRAAIGIGEASISRRESSYEEDGVAYVQSRRALEGIAKSRPPARWTKLATGDAQIDDVADVVLCLMDHMLQTWTVPQWEAIRWALLGLKREEIGRKLQVAHQNVTKRLLAAGWPYFEPGMQFLRRLLTEAGTREGVQTHFAPS